VNEPTEGTVRFDVQRGRDQRGERVAVVRQKLMWVAAGEVAVFRGDGAAERAARFVESEPAS
jgi:mRNA-degrading endonuclease toxin of MazEF toxin-antitoxin module